MLARRRSFVLTVCSRQDLHSATLAICMGRHHGLQRTYSSAAAGIVYCGLSDLSCKLWRQWHHKPAVWGDGRGVLTFSYSSCSEKPLPAYQEINHCGDGGLYAELIRNRAFQGSSMYPSNLDAWNLSAARRCHFKTSATLCPLLSRLQQG